jgi:hypothetical protein
VYNNEAVAFARYIGFCRQSDEDVAVPSIGTNILSCVALQINRTSADSQVNRIYTTFHVLGNCKEFLESTKYLHNLLLGRIMIPFISLLNILSQIHFLELYRNTLFSCIKYATSGNSPVRWTSRYTSVFRECHSSLFTGSDLSASSRVCFYISALDLSAGFQYTW